jgi:hypothetical protein
MTSIKAAHAAPRQRHSPRNGLPEPVPYVYGQQTRRNTYAARIARRNIQGWWQPPAALPGPKVTTLRPGLRPEGVALRAVRLTGRDEPGTFGAWLMTSAGGTETC